MKLQLLFFALCLTSCAYVDYRAYEGAPVAPDPSAGTFVSRDYGLPIYDGRPPRAFQVIGLIESSERNMVPEGTDHAAVRVAKSKGADALIKIDRRSQYAGSQGGWYGSPYYNNAGSVWTSASYTESAKYLAIRWIN